MSDNKWQLAFWIITTFCGVWLLALTQGVVANDRIRASEDQRVEAIIGTSMKDISKNIEIIAVDMREIKIRLNFLEQGNGKSIKA